MENHTDNTIVVRKALSKDLPAVASQHRDQFGDHLLGQYSPGLLQGFYGTFVGEVIFLVAEFQGRICGFVMGGDRAALQMCKSRFTKKYALKILVESLLRPGVWPFLVSRLVKSFHRGGRLESSCHRRLLSISVSSEFQGRGVASELVTAFESAIGSGEYGLSVVSNNARAVAFYRKSGYEEEFRKGHSIFFRKVVQSEEDG